MRVITNSMQQKEIYMSVAIWMYFDHRTAEKVKPTFYKATPG